MGVQVDRKADLLAQRGDQLLSRIGLEKACHVLNGQNMGTAALQLFCHLYIVLKGVFIVLGIENITGIADGRLKNLILAQDFVHGDGHALDPVE